MEEREGKRESEEEEGALYATVRSKVWLLGTCVMILTNGREAAKRCRRSTTQDHSRTL